MARRKPNIITADYHRNGVGGRGFNVAIIRNPMPDAAGDFLYIEFPGDDCAVAVLRVSDVAAHTIRMHEDGAAWRGDQFKAACSALVEQAISEQYAAYSAAFREREEGT